MAKNAKTSEIKIKNKKTELHVICRSADNVQFYKFMNNFTRAVFKIVKMIPKGETRTYKNIAVAAGRPKAWRAVGNILSKNFDQTIPCHRVICSDGKLGGYNRGILKKSLLLKNEKAV